MPKTRQTQRDAAIRGFIEAVRAGQIPGIGTPNPMRVLTTVNVEEAPEGRCAVCHCELVGRQTMLCSGHWDYVLFDETDVRPYTEYLTRLADWLEATMESLHVYPHWTHYLAATRGGSVCEVCEKPTSHAEDLIDGTGKLVKRHYVCKDHVSFRSATRA